MPELLHLSSDVWETESERTINVCLEFPIYGVPPPAPQLSDTIGQFGAKLNIQHMLSLIKKQLFHLYGATLFLKENITMQNCPDIILFTFFQTKRQNTKIPK